MHAVDGMQENGGTLAMDSMVRPVRGAALKWSARRTVLFVAASSTVLWSAIATTAWLVI